MSSPLAIVVTGMPGAGKTTVARAVAGELSLPVVSKDDIKGRLYDALGVGDAEWSQRLGAATYSLVFAFCGELLAVGRSVIAEANFVPGRHERAFRSLPVHRVAQIHCHAPLDVLENRFRTRPRHPGHLDEERVAELAARLRSGAHAPLALDGELVELDTSQLIDLQSLIRKLRPLLAEDGAATIPTP